MQYLAFSWVLIPLLGIGAGMFKEWLKFKERQRQLGASTEELERLVAELKKRDQALNERIENLEAIVVSQTWEVLHDRALNPAERERRLVSTAQREMPPPPFPDSQKAEVLARRLKA
jgi:hypothetical protein